MASTHIDIETAEWTPGTPFYGPAAVYMRIPIMSAGHSD
jgi:hypothetical protein